MKIKDRQKTIHKYGSKIQSDETIDKVIELFYTEKDNTSASIAKLANVTSAQVLNILNSFDDNVKNYERIRTAQ